MGRKAQPISSENPTELRQEVPSRVCDDYPSHGAPQTGSGAEVTASDHAANETIGYSFLNWTLTVIWCLCDELVLFQEIYRPLKAPSPLKGPTAGTICWINTHKSQDICTPDEPDL